MSRFWSLYTFLDIVPLLNTWLVKIFSHLCFLYWWKTLNVTTRMSMFLTTEQKHNGSKTGFRKGLARKSKGYLFRTGFKSRRLGHAMFWCDYQRIQEQEEKESAKVEEEKVKQEEKNNNNIIVIVNIYWPLTRCQEHFLVLYLHFFKYLGMWSLTGGLECFTRTYLWFSICSWHFAFIYMESSQNSVAIFLSYTWWHLNALGTWVECSGHMKYNLPRAVRIIRIKMKDSLNHCNDQK